MRAIDGDRLRVGRGRMEPVGIGIEPCMEVVDMDIDW